MLLSFARQPQPGHCWQDTLEVLALCSIHAPLFDNSACACVLQDQITVLTGTLSALTQFVTGFISNTTACILQDPLCSTCLDLTTCKICHEVRQ